MLERFGFTGDKLTARLGDLSGGERRRFQLLSCCCPSPTCCSSTSPPTTSTSTPSTWSRTSSTRWPGTLVVVSHDRYFLERVTDSIWALMGDGQIACCRGGWTSTSSAGGSELQAAPSAEPGSAVRAERAVRVGGASGRPARRSTGSTSSSPGSPHARRELHDEMAANADDHEKLTELSAELHRLADEKDELEGEWLEAAAVLE